MSLGKTMKQIIISGKVPKRWQEKGMFSDMSIGKMKSKLRKALEITLYYMISFLNVKPRQKGRADLAIHHKTLNVMMKIDVTKPLECGKVIGNEIPSASLFQSPFSCDDPHTNFYHKHHLATQTQHACYGDKSVNFQKFNFGLTGRRELNPARLLSLL